MALGKKVSNYPTQGSIVGVGSVGDGSVRQQKHITISNTIAMLEATSQAYKEFVDELRGQQEPPCKAVESQDPSFADVICGSSERLGSLNDRFRNILDELRQLIL